MAVGAIALLEDKQQVVEFHFYKKLEIKIPSKQKKSREALERKFAATVHGSYCLAWQEVEFYFYKELLWQLLYCLAFRQMAKVEFTFLVLAVGAS